MRTLFHCLALSLAGVTAAPAHSLDGPSVRVGRTVEITRSHIWCWFPTLHRFRSGELLVSINMCPDEVNSESAFSAYCISKDGGSTWSRRYTLGAECLQDAWSEDPDENDQVWNWGSYPEPAPPEDGRTFYASMTRFGHGGRTLSEDHDVVFTLARAACMYPAWLFDYRPDWKNRTVNSMPDTRFDTQFSGRPTGNIIHDRSGALVCAAYYIGAEDQKRALAERRVRSDPRRYIRVVLLRSTDGGRHWSEVSTIADVPPGERPSWMGGEGPNESSLALLKDGRLYCVYRTGGRDGMIGNSWSSDDGKTWTKEASIGFMGVAPRLHRLHDGMLALVTGRPGPVELRFNPDGNGERWSKPITLFTGRCTCYTDFAEVRPGRLLVVYDSIPYGWYEIPFSDREARNIIYGKFVDYGNP